MVPYVTKKERRTTFVCESAACARGPQTDLAVTCYCHSWGLQNIAGVRREIKESEREREREVSPVEQNERGSPAMHNYYTTYR